MADEEADDAVATAGGTQIMTSRGTSPPWMPKTAMGWFLTVVVAAAVTGLVTLLVNVLTPDDPPSPSPQVMVADSTAVEKAVSDAIAESEASGGEVDMAPIVDVCTAATNEEAAKIFSERTIKRMCQEIVRILLDDGDMSDADRDEMVSALWMPMCQDYLVYTREQEEGELGPELSKMSEEDFAEAAPLLCARMRLSMSD